MTFNHRAMDVLLQLEQRGLTDRDHVVNAALVAFGHLPKMDQDEYLKMAHEPVAIKPSSEPVLGARDPGHIRVPPAPAPVPEAPKAAPKKAPGPGRWPKKDPPAPVKPLSELREEQKLTILKDDDVDSIFGKVEV